MVYNTVEEIKRVLLLEDENQTMTDDEIEDYISDANEEMIADIKRSFEYDSFVSEKSGTVIFYPYFNVVTINRVVVNDVDLDSSEYSVSSDGDGVQIPNIKIGDVVETYTIPSNYKQYERAICVTNIRSRINPWSGDSIDGIYAIWNAKRKNFRKALLGKFGATAYNG